MEENRHHTLSVFHHPSPSEHHQTEKKAGKAQQELNRVNELATKILGYQGKKGEERWTIEKAGIFPIGVTFVAPDGSTEKLLYEPSTRYVGNRKVFHRVNLDPPGDPNGIVRSVSSRDLNSIEDLAPDDPLRAHLLDRPSET